MCPVASVSRSALKSQAYPESRITPTFPVYAKSVDALPSKRTTVPSSTRSVRPFAMLDSDPNERTATRGDDAYMNGADEVTATVSPAPALADLDRKLRRLIMVFMASIVSLVVTMQPYLADPAGTMKMQLFRKTFWPSTPPEK